MPHTPEYQGKPAPEPGGWKPEGQPLPYYLAARFPTKQEAEKPYFEAQEVIRTTDCDLSTYRFFVPQQLTQPRPWYVVAIGDTPPEAVQQRITTILSQGELAALPEEAIHDLYRLCCKNPERNPMGRKLSVLVQFRPPLQTGGQRR